MEDTLAALQVNGVPSGRVRVHLLSHENNYTTVNVSKDTALRLGDAPNFGFYSLFSDGDVMAIKPRNTFGTASDPPRVEVHVLTADSGYQEFDIERRTPITVGDAPNFVFRSSDGTRDLFAIKTKNTGS